MWVTNTTAFNGDLARESAAQILALAEKQGDKVMLMVGQRCVAFVLVLTGNFAEALAHYDQAIALYDPVEHRLLTTRFGQTEWRIFGRWRCGSLGYPDAGLASTEQALNEARETGHAASLMPVMDLACDCQLISANYATTKALSDELIALAEEKGAIYWKTARIVKAGQSFGLNWQRLGRSQHLHLDACPHAAQWEQQYRLPWHLCHLARACGELGQFEEAWSYIGEAITAVETTKEKWCEAEVHRIAGEIALMSPERDLTKAEACFEQALAVARQQQAKSWELRAAMSMARLWREQGKRDEARELLAPIYGWFTEGFDTVDLKQAKALLDELTA